MDSNNWIQFYDNLAKQHDNCFQQAAYLIDGKPPSNEQLFDQWAQQIAQQLNISPDHSLIDIGCGPGIFLKRFAKYTSHLYGTDSSKEQINSAKKNCPQVKLEVGDALAAPFGDTRFDLIFCNGVFLLFDSLNYAKKVVSHFLSISKDNAKILIGDLPLPTLNMQQPFRRKTKATNWEVQHYPIEFFYELCNELGYQGCHLKQEVAGKESAAFRYDFLISKS